jgi:hypothetical protein
MIRAKKELPELARINFGNAVYNIDYYSWVKIDKEIEAIDEISEKFVLWIIVDFSINLFLSNKSKSIYFNPERVFVKMAFFECPVEKTSMQLRIRFAQARVRCLLWRCYYKVNSLRS